MGIILLLIVLVVLFVVVNFWLFFSKTFSPIPFYPTNAKDLRMIVDTLLSSTDNTNGIIVDLGAGTGTVIFAAAHETYRRKLNISFLAVEIHPLLVFIMNIRRLFHPYRKSITITRADMFKYDFSRPQTHNSQLMTIYLYVGPFVMERLKKKLGRLPPKTTIISYMYAILGWERKLTGTKTNINPLYIYAL